jgi:hypothetical protein
MHLPRVCLAVSFTVWLCAIVILASCDTPTSAVYITSACADRVPTLHISLHSDKAAQYRLNVQGNFGSHAMPAEHMNAGDTYIKRRPKTGDIVSVIVETYQEAEGTWTETDYTDVELCD